MKNASGCGSELTASLLGRDSQVQASCGDATASSSPGLRSSRALRPLMLARCLFRPFLGVTLFDGWERFARCASLESPHSPAAVGTLSRNASARRTYFAVVSYFWRAEVAGVALHQPRAGILVEPPRQSSLLARSSRRGARTASRRCQKQPALPWCVNDVDAVRSLLDASTGAKRACGWTGSTPSREP